MTVDEPPFDPDYDRPADTSTIPADLDAERAVLACLIHDPSLATRLATHLTASDFWNPAHGRIWDAIHHLHNTGTPGDPVILSSHLTATGQTDLTRLLPDLLTNPANTPLAEHYTKIVRDQARLRVALEVSTKIRQLVTRGQAGMVDHYLGDALQEIEDATTRWGPRDTTTHTGLADLAFLLTGDIPPRPEPTYVRRDDGVALFYPGLVNGIFGDPDAAKSWLAQTAGVQALTAGGTFAIVDVDHNGANHTAGRLLLLGAKLTDLADPTRFRYYEPEDADQLRAASDDITRWAPNVTVIDSLGEVIPMMGAKSIDNDEVTAVVRRIITPPATAGSCVITIDHLPKGTDARATGYAIGGTSKKRYVRGTYLRAEARIKPAPGQIGKITLRLEKDTNGSLAEHTPGGYVGTFTLDSTRNHEGITTWAISRSDSPIADDGRFRPTQLMEKVSRYVEDNDQCSGRDIQEDVRGNAKYLREALRILITEGFITTLSGPKRSTLHHSIAHYREAEDDTRHLPLED